MAIKIKSIECATKELSSESSMTPATKEIAIEGIRNDYALANKLLGEKHKCLDAWLSACLSGTASASHLREMAECYHNTVQLLNKHCESMERTCAQISRDAMDAAYQRERVNETKPDCNVQAVSPSMSSDTKERSAPKLTLKIEAVSSSEERKGV